ncbi:MAG: hypothetical protein KIT43_07800 [Bauldia sp.]|nr:hypothetical protein [Bauldia sp.]MCW5718848.1 hypothetical protein [Bauldia sp.]
MEFSVWVWIGAAALTLTASRVLLLSDSGWVEFYTRIGRPGLGQSYAYFLISMHVLALAISAFIFSWVITHKFGTNVDAALPVYVTGAAWFLMDVVIAFAKGRRTVS